jgi:cytochrome c peroxidase
MKKQFFSKRLMTGLGLIASIALAVSFTVRQDIFRQPANFPAPYYNTGTNPVTDAGFALGKKLFYDPILSADYTISCGSCHIQAAAFSHHGHDLSHGIHDLLGTRNAPGLQNLAWYSRYMWDGGITNLDLQPIAPITNPVEMGDTLSAVMRKLNTHSLYPGLFEKAFGTDSITTDLVMKALSQFMISLVSADSKYDKVMRKEGASFSPDEANGYQVFQEKCASCHPEPLFTDQQFRSSGLPILEEGDEGRYLVSLDSNERFTFRVPSLRNLKFTFPYMHDGRFYTIDEVLDHYATGISHATRPDPAFKLPDGRFGIPVSPDQRKALKAFLLTLNDTAFVKNPLYDEAGSQLYIK